MSSMGMSETRRMILDTLDRLVADTVDTGLRQRADLQGANPSPEPLPAALWSALEAQGMTELGETAEGDLGYADALALVGRAAYHALPVPLAETVLARRLLARAGLNIPDGPITVAPPGGGHGVGRTGGGTVTGVVDRVPWGRSVRHAVAAVGEGQGASIVLLDITGATREQRFSMAGEPRDTIDLARARQVSAAGAADAARVVETEGALVRAVQIAGALAATLDHCLTWTGDRIQFGKPIARFQAVQHLMSDLACEVTAGRAAADLAVEASIGSADRLAVAIAKARTGEAAGRAASIAHGLFGAMGFTKEHALNTTTRRLWSWRDEFGSEVVWQTEIGRTVAAVGADALWPLLTRSA